MLKHLNQRRFVIIIIISLLGLLSGLYGLLWLTVETASAPSLTSTTTASSTEVITSTLPPAYTPTREAYAGCVWEQIVGAGISLYGQRCTSDDRVLALGISETLPGVFLEEQTLTGPIALDELIRIFTLETGDISDILPVLAQSSTWDPSEGCVFTKNEGASTPTVTRYDLAPSGAALTDYLATASLEPVTSTCDEYGMGNSGIRYFEIHASNPKKAIFLEVGQEAPLFDEYSILVF